MIGLLEAEVHAILAKVLGSPPNRRPCPGRAHPPSPCRRNPL